MTDERRANAVDRRIGQRVRARRLEISMSQERLAALLGVTFQQVQKYEKGTNRVGASRLQNISTTLNVPVSFFFEDAPEQGAGTKNAAEGLMTFVGNHAKLIQALMALEGDQLLAVQRLALTMAPKAMDDDLAKAA